MSVDFSEFEKKVDLNFSNKELLKQAFTHRSYLNENKGLKIGHNERLEFLGDAVLELIVTDYLFNKYTERPEGELTSLRSALVNALTLSAVALKLGMNDYLLLSRGEAKDVGRARTYILANTFEAVLGAIYMDQGYEKTKDFIAAHIFPLLEEIVEKESWMDAKSRFQELAQEETGITPSYRTTKEAGPDHDKLFTVGLYLNNDLIVTGEGSSKQDAEQDAARKGLEVKAWG